MTLDDVNGLAPTDPLWARLEIRAEDTSQSGGAGLGRTITDTGISLNGLIEILSRPPPSPQSRWVTDTGPVTLEALRGVRR